MATSKTPADNSTGLFNLLLYRFLPFWPLFAILIIVSVAVAWYHIRYLTPMYESTAKILIKDESQELGDSKLMDAFDVSSSKKKVENEIEVIHSRSLMKKVVHKLDLYAPVFEEGKLKPVAAYTTSPISIEIKNPEQLIEAKKVFFNYDSKSKLVEINGKKYPLGNWVKTPYGELLLVPNMHKTGTATAPLFFNLVHPNNVAGALLANLNISPVSRTSSVVILKLKDDVPVRGENILNELSATYTSASINDKNATAINTLSFVEDRIKYVEDDLDALEKKIQHYKSAKGIVDLSEQGKLFLQNLGTNDQKAADISVQLSVLDQVEKYVVSKDNRAGIVPSTLGVSEPILNELLGKLYNSEIDYEKLKKTTAENNPIMVSVKSEMEKIRPSILENIRNQRNTLKASMGNINSTSGAFSSMLKNIPQQEKELLDFSRQQAIKSSVYTYLLQKREETALSHSATVADNRVIDPAQSSMIPYSPNKPTIYLISILLTMGLGVAIVMAKEKLSTKIIFRSEIETFSTVPIVAEITKIKGNTSLVVNDPKHIVVAEQFRHLRAAIGLYGRGTGKRKLLVTSSISGEGKSFVSANLAFSLALSGKKVVLLDIDLRNPKSTQMFNLTNAKGVTEFLEGKCEPYEIVKATQQEQLFIVPVGRAAANPTELLLNDKLDHLFKYLGEAFDYLVVDTSPIDPVTDAYILSEYCDTTLFVVRHGYTPKTMVQLLDENNKIKALKNLAIIFNGVKPRGFMKRGYGFGYGYGYENVYQDRVYRRTSKQG